MDNTTGRFKLAFPPILLVLLFWASSFAGLDFGVHWDETRAKFDSVKKSVETGLLIQSVGEADGFSYNYGGVNYWLTWAGFTPELARYAVDGRWTQKALADAILPIVYAPGIRLRVRAIYLILSSLSILWLYCLCLQLGRSWRESFLAAAILSLSWEVAYHSRWVAPDAVVMQFGLLAFLLMVLGQRKGDVRWFHAAAIVTGLTAGTKYPGAFILPFLLVGVAHTLWRQTRRLTTVAREVLLTTMITGAAFVVTTPGVVLDPFHFFIQLKEQQTTYADGWYGYTVVPGVAHLGQMLQYFSLEVFSHFLWLSGILALFCVVGLLVIAVERRLALWLMAGFCVVYSVFFSAQAAMLVRNYLVVVPFLALAAARGVAVFAERWSPRVLYGVVAALLSVNLGWDLYAAQQIRNRTDIEYFLRKFEAYARAREGETFLVSADLLEQLRRLPDPVPGNVVVSPAMPYSEVAFLQSEGADRFWEKWPANRVGFYAATFGAQEVNLDRYPTFVGNQRVLVVSRDRLSQLPVTAEYLTASGLVLSKSDVVAGKDSYDLRIKSMPDKQVVLRYSYEGGQPAEFTQSLKASGEAHFDVGAATKKGAYRYLGYRLADSELWHDADATIVVK